MNRPILLANYLIDNKTTIRGVAKVFGVSKSTAHLDLSKRLKYIDRSLYHKVKAILEQNYSERHIRGGNATKKKYANKI